MSPFSEMRLVVGRELKKNLRSIKGLILLVISLLGASATAFRLRAIEIDVKDVPDATPAMIHELKAEVIKQAFYHDTAVADYLANAPLKLVLIFFLAVWLSPMLVTLMGFDLVSSETQYRTARYWTVRTRRGSYFFGKFLGLWAVMAAVTFVMHLLTWIVVLARGEAGLGETLSWGIRFWLFALPVSAIWCGLATFLGSLFRTPILSLLTICLTFALIFFFGFAIDAIVSAGSKGVDHVTWLTYIYPNTYDAWLASPLAYRAGLGFLICLGYAGLPTAAGALIFARRDI